MKQRATQLYLLAVVLLGAALRLRGLGIPSLWLDEILGYDLAAAAAKQPLWRWLTMFDPEHGSLYYASELATRFVHPAELSARMAPALFGIAGIVVAWVAASAIDTHPAAKWVLPILIGVSPLEVYYSREARPYALVLLLTTALLAVLLRGPATRVAMVMALLLIAIYATATVAPVVMAIAIAATGAAIGGDRRFWLTIAGAALVSSVVIAFAYHPVQNIGADQFPRLDGSFFRALIESFSAVALDTTRMHRSAYVFLALAVIGAIDLARRRWTQAFVLVAMTLLPLLIGIVGIRLMHHFFSVRYVISALPGYLLLVSIGVAAIVRCVPRRTAAVAIAVGIAALLVAQGWRAALDEPYRKLDWRTIAHTIAAHAHENDAVIAANQWTVICLGFYLRGVSPHVRLFDAAESRMMGEVFAYQNAISWIVSANARAEFAEWSCRFPVVLASPQENFRVHYSPTLYYFLTDRSTAAEQRAILASFDGSGPALHFGPGEDAFFDPGWGGAEPEEGRYARWAIGRRARIALPLGPPADRTITLELAPVSYPKAPPQTVSIRVNDQPAGTLTLQPARSHYAVEAPRTLWRNAVNILTFVFDHATAPADIDPRSSDHRSLAARFYEVSLAGPTTPSADIHLVRLAEDGPFLERTQGDRLLPDHVDAERLTQFAGRLGFDPQRALAGLLDDRVTLADLAAASLVDDALCLDDQSFLATVFRALLGREISARERASFGLRLQHGEARGKIVRDLVNSDEVRDEVTGATR